MFEDVREPKPHSASDSDHRYAAVPDHVLDRSRGNGEVKRDLLLLHQPVALFVQRLFWTRLFFAIRVHFEREFTQVFVRCLRNLT